MNEVYPNECIRPSTMAEMMQALKSGTPCEVLESFASTAKMVMEVWAGFSDFKILGPANGGWVCFTPINTKEPK